MPLIAGALASLGTVRALVVHGAPGMDEVSPMGPTRVIEIRDGKMREWVIDPAYTDTFADPAVIRGKDGYWYAFGTTDPLRSGEGRKHSLPIAKSRDLVQGGS